MVPEAPLAHSELGLHPSSTDGWFVLNARDARWRDRGPRGKSLPFTGPLERPQLNVVLYVLGPGEPIGMYHWEANQEDFLVLSGEATLLIEGEERPLRAWDFVHCPAGADHMIVGAGDAPCTVLAIGASGQTTDGVWGGYVVDEVARRHRTSVEAETSDVEEAYAHWPDVVLTAYGGWLP